VAAAVGRQALLVMAHLRKGETFADLACGFGVGTSTVYRYLREAIRLARRAGTHPGTSDRGRSREGLRDPDGALLRIDRVGTAGGRDRPFYSASTGVTDWMCRSLPTRPDG
jgi:hypothetical protein